MRPSSLKAPPEVIRPARERKRQEKALAAAAETPRGETPLPSDLSASTEATELLELGEKLRQHDVRFLRQLDHAARHGDPALARQALDELLHAAHALTIHHRELAERLLDAHPIQAPAPGETSPGPVVSPRGETEAGPDTDPTAG
ncbi:hypothetical protein GCM10010430_76170 [Kitasatospora cystarginea]|uniref:Uncharacterized protein n=1 Tax=Kitasatospora cystarginea TaxID=58350 RepID=A0ABN3EZJ2_9ACTN